MSKFLSLLRPREEHGWRCKSCKNKELKYDPGCAISKEEFEWRCAQHERVYQRMPQVLHKLTIQLLMMRHHFKDDPDALKIWDEYQNYVHDAFAHKLPGSLSSPLSIPDSVLYKQLMKRKARSKTFVGMVTARLDKLKQATSNKRLVVAGAIVASVAAGFAVGRTPSPWKQQQQTKET